MAIKVLIFDLGNVVLNFDMQLIARKFARLSSMEEQKLYELFFDSPLTQSHDEGKINAQEFYRQAKKITGAEISFDEFRTIWNEIFAENTGVTELLRALFESKRYKIFLMSNTNKMHFDYIKEKFDIIKQFDHVLTSYEVGERKPHPKIYREAIAIAETDPANMLFIDDRIELVEGAKHMGINAVQYKNIKQLKDDLTKHEVALN